MAAATQRKAHRSIAPEKSSAVGSVRLLPAGEEIDWSALPNASAADEVGPAAMAEGKDVEKKQAKGDKISKASKGDKSTTRIVDLAAKALNGKFKSGSTPREGDPDVSYAFSVTIDNQASGMFSEVGGLSWKAESIPIRSGGNNEHGYHLKGPGKFEPLTLKRGFFAANTEFFDMLKGSLAALSVEKDRYNVTIAVLNRRYESIAEYQLKNAFIIEYTGLQLNSTGSQVGFEQIRMAYDYFELKKK